MLPPCPAPARCDAPPTADDHLTESLRAHDVDRPESAKHEMYVTSFRFKSGCLTLLVTRVGLSPVRWIDEQPGTRSVCGAWPTRQS